MFPLEFHGKVKHQKTRVIGILCGEGCINAHSLLQLSLTNPPIWWMDRQTDGRMGKTTTTTKAKGRNWGTCVSR